MKPRIIAEIGSTHMGKMKYCKEAIDLCLDLKIDAIKFQLFPNEPKYLETGNVWLSPDLYLEAANYAFQEGLDCSASVFDEDSFQFLLKTNPPFIKFSYSKKEEFEWICQAMENDIEAIVSCDIMTDHIVPRGATKLFCLPHYPVYFEVNFTGIFPRFHGFSDHTLGYEQTYNAIEKGAQIIEKHITLGHRDIVCPDSYFALTPNDLRNLMALVNR